MSIKRRKSKPIAVKLGILIASGMIIFASIMSIISMCFYYYSLNSVTIKQISVTSRQIVNDIETYFSNISTLSNAINSKILNYDAQNNKEIESYFNDIKELNKDVSNISIFSSEGSFLVGDSKVSDKDNAIKKSWFIYAQREELIGVYSSIGINENNEYYFSYSKVINYDHETKYGVLKLDLNFNSVIDLISFNALGENGRIMILDQNDKVVFTSLDKFYSKDILSITSLILGESKIKIDRTSYYLYCNTILGTGWSIGVFSNISSLDTILSQYVIFIIILTILSVICATLVTLILSRGITNPIKVLQYKIKSIEDLEYDPKLLGDVKGTLEVEELSQSFKALLFRMKDLTNKLVQERELQRQTELIALQNQINPHFLYNTLDSILAMIDENENEKAEKMIISLSKFFRLSIAKGENIIPLSQEIMHAKYYLEIQTIRFENKFSYEFDIDPKILEYKIPKLILQPLIENSIEHGVGEDIVDGKITIKGYEDDKFFYLSVIDTGLGITNEKIQEIYAGFTDLENTKSVGLFNVYQRLNLYFRSDMEFLILNQENTTFLLKLPKGVKDDEK